MEAVLLQGVQLHKAPLGLGHYLSPLKTVVNKNHNIK